MAIDRDARDLINARLQCPNQLTLSVVDFCPNPQNRWIPPFVLLSTPTLEIAIAFAFDFATAGRIETAFAITGRLEDDDDDDAAEAFAV